MSFEPSKTKADALKRLGQALGYEFPLYVGSSVPKELFTAATRRAHVADEGSMPVRAERVVLAAGLQWGKDCDSRSTPSGGGATVTLTGLNRLLEAIQILGTFNGSAVPEPETEEFGQPYVTKTGAVTAEPVTLTQDWNALDESTRAHQALESALADYVRSLGVEPRSPRAAEPQFDLAWQYDGTTVVVEVKSATDANHRQQARLGVGQVLEYAAILQDNAPADYRTVLLLGQPPEPLDYLLAANSGVLVIGEAQFNELALDGLAP